jgi:cation diffusion facilitator CzcD-associated flavoprotein CzcO
MASAAMIDAIVVLTLLVCLTAIAIQSQWSWLWSVPLASITVALASTMAYHSMTHASQARMVREQCIKRNFKVGIIGGGVSGISAAVYLQRQGIPFELFEKSAHLGGTWFDNNYPGCACDVPSHLYSYSFLPNPWWSERNSLQLEILQYLQRVVDTFGLKQHTRLQMELVDGRWDDEEKCWIARIKHCCNNNTASDSKPTTVGDSDGGSDGDTITTHRFSALVIATGQLNKPKFPEIQGSRDFEGLVLHSARWPARDCNGSDGLHLSDKSVVCIGNGASAVQLVPAIAKRVKSLTIVQRSPNWLMPRNNAPFASWTKSMFAYVPLAHRTYRYWLYLLFETNWTFLVAGSYASAYVRRDLTKFIKSHVDDEQLLAKLLPEYAPGCKRVLLTDDYLPALLQPHVHLVDGKIEQILRHAVRVTPSASKATVGSHSADKAAAASSIDIAADAIVYLTGFDTNHFCLPAQYYGKENVEMQQVFDGTPAAYLGITVPRMPNLFLLYGPNTNLGHNSIMYVCRSTLLLVLRYQRP